MTSYTLEPQPQERQRNVHRGAIRSLGGPTMGAWASRNFRRAALLLRGSDRFSIFSQVPGEVRSCQLQLGTDEKDSLFSTVFSFFPPSVGWILHAGFSVLGYEVQRDGNGVLASFPPRTARSVLDLVCKSLILPFL